MNSALLSALALAVSVCPIGAAAQLSELGAGPSSSTSQPTRSTLGCSPQWLSLQGPAPTADGSIEASCVYDDGAGPALYVGGSFSEIGGVNASGVAKWNGAQWSSTGWLVGDVAAMAVYDGGAGPELYAAGDLQAVNGLPVGGIARFDGSQWSDVGGGFVSTGPGWPINVVDLCVYDDGAGPQLYAIGGFVQAGAVPAYRLARWNGQSWSAVPGSFHTGSASSLAVHPFGSGQRLVVGGQLYLPSISGVTKLATFDGASWTRLATIAGSVTALASLDTGSGPRLYVAGDLIQLDGFPAQRAANWNGVAWTFMNGLPSSTPNPIIECFAVHTDGPNPRVFAAGSFAAANGLDGMNVARWNGSSWSTPVQAPTPPVFTMTNFAFQGSAALFIGGLDYSNGMLAYVGSSWSTFGDGFSGPVHAVHEHHDSNGSYLIAGGRFGFVGGVRVRNVARWDGVQWSPMGDGFNGPVRALEVVNLGAGPTLFATGEFTQTGATPVARIARWSGSQWMPLGTGLSHAGLVLRGHDFGAGASLYVGGRFTTAGGVVSNGIARWNGSTWSALGSGATSWFSGVGPVFAMESFGGELVVGGGFPSMSGLTCNNVARWNGAQWLPLGAGVRASAGASLALTLAAHDAGAGPELYVGGDFDYAAVNDGSETNLARWNGVSWSAVPGAPFAQTQAVQALASAADSNGRALYVAHFSNFAVGGLERWDGAWSSAGSFTDGPALLAPIMSASGVQLLVGGGFRSSPNGDAYLAAWETCTPCPPPVNYCTSGTSMLGCVAQMTSFGAPSVSQTSGFILSAANVDGMRQGVVFYGINGPIAAPWHPFSSSWRCVRGPVQRLSAGNSGGTAGFCNGALQVDLLAFVAAHPGALGAPFAAGLDMRAQAWYRDPQAAGTSSLSDALWWTMCP